MPFCFPGLFTAIPPPLDISEPTTFRTEVDRVPSKPTVPARLRIEVATWRLLKYVCVEPHSNLGVHGKCGPKRSPMLAYHLAGRVDFKVNFAAEKRFEAANLCVTGSSYFCLRRPCSWWLSCSSGPRCCAESRGSRRLRSTCPAQGNSPPCGVALPTSLRGDEFSDSRVRDVRSQRKRGVDGCPCLPRPFGWEP